MDDYSYFEVRGKKYRLRRLNWQYEEKFLIAASGAGFDLTGEAKDVNLLSEGGKNLREEILPWLMVEDGENWKFLDANTQVNHFSSIIEVYEVLGKEVELISSFLSQAQESTPENSSLPQVGKSENSGQLQKPGPTSSA